MAHEQASSQLQNAGRPPAPDPVHALIHANKQRLALALPGMVTKEMMPGFLRALYEAVAKYPQMLANQSALLAACVEVMQSGLIPGRSVYILPYKNKGTVVPTVVYRYMGLAQLAYRSGEVKVITAGTVREGDDFDANEVTGATRWVRNTDDDAPARLYFAYAQLLTGGEIVITASRRDMEAFRDSHAAAKSPGTPWVEHFDAQAEKTMIKRLITRRLPISYQPLMRAMQIDERPIVGTAASGFDGFEMATIDAVSEPTPTPTPEPTSPKSAATPPPSDEVKALRQSIYRVTQGWPAERRNGFMDDGGYDLGAVPHLTDPADLRAVLAACEAQNT